MMKNIYVGIKQSNLEWLNGWLSGSKSGFIDYLQQSKIV
jgi:hypothetical protein